MQNIEKFVKERQEIKPLHTCESYFLTFPKKICGVSVIRFAFQKTVQVDTRFYEAVYLSFLLRYCLLCALFQPLIVSKLNR